MTYKLYLAVLLLCISPLNWAASSVKEDDMSDLDVEDLLKVNVLALAKKSQVTSVSKKTEALSDAPAAVFIISNDDIKRSGATSVPEALRMAPGLDVARINSNKWAITARGFNGSLANKLLVLMDGRSVYTPSFAGVYWDAQDVMLEDVERIEVIRGPGATMWGANAVNGVINIITKRAEQTQGGLLTGGGGTLEKGFAGLRYGTKLAKDSYGRVYVKGFERDNFNRPDGDNAGDDWNKLQGGFRLDSQLSKQDEITVQGDIYRTAMNQALSIPNLATYHQNISDKVDSAGWNITSRLRHTFSSTAEYSLQIYYDHTQRDEYFARQRLDTFDIDFQNSFRLTDEQNVIWGLGYRVNMDRFIDTPMLHGDPSKRNTQLFSGFVQNEITLLEDTLWFTLGSKFEHNDYTGFEFEPSARLMWAPTPKQRIWASVSRAVRTPARGERDAHIYQSVINSPPISQLGGLSLPVRVIINGDRNYYSEVQFAYELGYRFTFSQQASLDLTAFYNDYHHLRSGRRGEPTLSISYFPLAINIEQPFYVSNGGNGSTYGFEASAVWQMTDWWRWDANYSYLKTYISDYSSNPTFISPQHKASLRAVINPIEDVSLDFWLRYNGASKPLTALTAINTPTNTIKDYVALDIRLAWKPHPALELSVAGQNLLNTQHLEYLDEAFVRPSEISRGVYGKVSWGF